MDTAEWEKHTVAATCLEWSGSRATDANAGPAPPWCLADLTAMPAVCLINLSLLLCSQAGDVEKILLFLLCSCAHTRSFFISYAQSPQRSAFKRHRLRTSCRKAHTLHASKLNTGRTQAKTKIISLEKLQWCNSLEKDKLITSQVLWSSAHWVFAAKKKETESLLPVHCEWTQHRQPGLKKSSGNS